MGLNFKCESIYKFDIENNGADEIFKEKFQMKNFATSIYNQTKIIMTGGIRDRDNFAKNSVVEFSFNVSEKNGSLELEKRVMPDMIQKRMKHCSFIARDFLFVFFGF